MSAFLDANSTAARRIAPTRGLLIAAVAGLCLLSGCGDRRPLAPVTGVVLYNGKPLESGTVFFQPEYGQPATAAIQPDGTFTLKTVGEGTGAVVGRNQVRIACYDKSTADGQGEGTLGRLLIPHKYTDYETSGLTVEVVPGQHEPIEIELTGQAGGP